MKKKRQYSPQLIATAYHEVTEKGVSVYCIVLLLYVHGKHLRSCRDGQLT